MRWVMARSWPGGSGDSRTLRYRLSIICILAGGVTSFHLGLCSVGGASIGLGWPLVGLFALAVAATMGQLASTFPTAGGLYHWAAILGGRGWGWTTAWFNLAGLITVLAAINVGTYRFALGASFPHPDRPDLDLVAQAFGVGLITFSQAAINHLGIGVTARLTDFSGYWILLVATVLDGLSFWRLPRLWTRRGWSPSKTSAARQAGASGRRLIGFALLFALGRSCPPIRSPASMPRRTPRKRPRGGRECAAGYRPLGLGFRAWRAGSCSVRWSWPLPSLPEAAAQGEGAFLSIMNGVLPRAAGRCAGRRDRRGPIPLRAGHGDLGFADGICLCTRRRASVLTCGALGLPQAAHRRPSRSGWSRWLRSLHDSHAGLRDDHRRVHHLPLYLVRAADRSGAWAYGRTWTAMGPWDLGRWYRPLAVLSVAGCAGLIFVGMQPPNERSHLGCGRSRAGAGGRLVRICPASLPRSTGRTQIKYAEQH